MDIRITHNLGGLSSIKLERLIVKLMEHLQDMPKASRAEATFEVDTSTGYGDSIDVNCTVNYTRPETTEEQAARLNLEERRRIKTEAQERRQFEYLKTKFKE